MVLDRIRHVHHERRPWPASYAAGNIGNGRPWLTWKGGWLVAQVTIKTIFDVDYYLDQVGADYYLNAEGEPRGSGSARARRTSA